MPVRNIYLVGTPNQIKETIKTIGVLDLNLAISCKEPIGKGFFKIEFKTEGGIMETARLDEYLQNTLV
jgi:CRISPR/Cas system CSM-associated protein Csm4 (group 5 of RAMP superfamily)